MMNKHTNSERQLSEWQLAEVLGQPQALFVLWAVNERLCSNLDDFRTHFGDTFPINELLRKLEQQSLIRQTDTGLALTDAGLEAVSYFAIDRAVVSHSEVSQVLRQLDELPEWESFGFPKGVVQVAKERLHKLIAQCLLHGDHSQLDANLHAFYEHQFEYYRTVWLPFAVPDAAAEVPSADGIGLLRDLALWYLIYGSMANFATSVPSFHCFLYHNARQESSLGSMKPGQWVRKQVLHWYRILAANMPDRSKKAQEHYLHYDDMQDLFRSADFITAYLSKEVFPMPDNEDEDWTGRREECLRYKTYLEKASPVELLSLGPFAWRFPCHQERGSPFTFPLGVRGWLAVRRVKLGPFKISLGIRGWLAVLRNHYALFVGHVFFFFVALCSGMQLWSVTAGIVALCIPVVLGLLWWPFNALMSVRVPAPSEGTPGFWWGLRKRWKNRTRVYSSRVPRPDQPARSRDHFDQTRSGPRWRMSRWISRGIGHWIVRRNIPAYLFWAIILCAKYLWSVQLFAGLKGPTETLAVSRWGYPGMQYMLLVCLWAPFLYFFFLDTFAYYSILAAVLGYVLGKHLGIGQVRSWYSWWEYAANAAYEKLAQLAGWLRQGLFWLANYRQRTADSQEKPLETGRPAGAEPDVVEAKSESKSYSARLQDRFLSQHQDTFLFLVWLLDFPAGCMLVALVLGLLTQGIGLLFGLHIGFTWLLLWIGSHTGITWLLLRISVPNWLIAFVGVLGLCLLLACHYAKKKWKMEDWHIRCRFYQARKHFYKKMLPPEVSRDAQRRQVAWAKTWNAILERLCCEDRLTFAEKERLCYGLDNTVEDNFLAGVVRKEACLIHAPRNAQARERLLFFLNSMLMEMPDAPSWDQIPSITVITPVHTEEVIYPFEDIDSRLDTGATVLTYLIARYPDEWENFIDRLRRDDKLADAKYILDAIKQVAYGRRLFLYGRPDQQAAVQQIKMEVRLWVSYRFQALARTVRGIMYHRDALYHLARIHHPTEWDAESDEPDARIKVRVNEKFQYLVYYELEQYSEKPEMRGRADAMRWLMQNYPELEVTYVVERNRALQPKEESIFQDRPGWYSVLAQGERIIHAIRLPDWPIDGAGTVKPERQNLALAFARGEMIQTIDMNQDGYFEEALKLPNALQEFRHDPAVKLLGFPERIITADYGIVAEYAAFADRIFVTHTQRVLNWFGARMHYGHPDIWDGTWATTRGGVSKLSYLNEDIYAAYDSVLQGARVHHVEYIQAGKAREVAVDTTAKMYGKFGSGAGEQAISRWIYRLNTSWRFGPMRQMFLFYGGLGGYIASPLVKYAILCYLVTILCMGVSGFASMSPEVFYGLLGFLIAQSLFWSGFAQLVLEGGLLRALWQYLKMAWLIVPFNQFHILTYASGFQQAMRAESSNFITGRGFLLNHRAASGLFHTFRSSHARWGLTCLGLLILGRITRQSYPLLWSLLFVVGALAVIYVPYLLNRGGTPLDVGMETWGNLFARDIDGKSERKVVDFLLFLLPFLIRPNVDEQPPGKTVSAGARPDVLEERSESKSWAALFQDSRRRFLSWWLLYWYWARRERPRWLTVLAWLLCFLLLACLVMITGLRLIILMAHYWVVNLGVVLVAIFLWPSRASTLMRLLGAWVLFYMASLGIFLGVTYFSEGGIPPLVSYIGRALVDDWKWVVWGLCGLIVWILPWGLARLYVRRKRESAHPVWERLSHLDVLLTVSGIYLIFISIGYLLVRPGPLAEAPFFYDRIALMIVLGSAPTLSLIGWIVQLRLRRRTSHVLR